MCARLEKFRPLTYPGSRSESGSITAFVTLMAVALFALFGLVIDGGNAMSAKEAAVVEAEQAARVGVDAISVDDLRSGTVQLDATSAVAAAQAFMINEGHPGTARVIGNSVEVTISYRMPTQVLGMIGLRALSVTAEATAVNVRGVTVASP